MGNKPWSGVFQHATDRPVEAFTESVRFDRRLAECDIRGSIAHAQMLAEVGLLTSDECQQIVAALEDIGQRNCRGTVSSSETDLEDVHMNIEAALVERLGDTGRKLHTGRSRNDQVSTDFRLWIRDAIDACASGSRAVQQAFVDRCDADFDVILPGYTHMQRAQPVLAPITGLPIARSSNAIASGWPIAAAV